MTVSSTTTSVSYNGNGSTTAFSVTFPFFEITVEEISALGVVTAKTEGTHYTVSGGAGLTGTVTMLIAPASGTTLRIRRTTARTQLTDYIDGEAFPADTTEQALDRAYMIIQEIEARVVLGTDTELTIASGVVTATGSYHSIDTEGNASTDDLDTILSAIAAGHTLLLSAQSSSRTVVLKDATGNLRLAGDFTMDHSNDAILLCWNGPSNVWFEVSRSDNTA